MKKSNLTIVCLLLIAGIWAAIQPVSSTPLSRQQASLNVQEFLKEKGINLNKVSMRHAPMKVEGNAQENAPYYVFNIGEGDGFVIASGDDCAQAILGYSQMGSFNADSIPDGLKSMLDFYAEQIQYCSKRSAVKSSVSNTSYPAVEPMLTTQWGQRYPYNANCPIYPKTNERCVTGCVATAMAQVMYYHRQHSTNVVMKNIPSYTSYEIGQEIEGISKGSPIDWDNMLDNYNNSPSEAQIQAVANLMLYCGIAVKMDYGLSSGAFFMDASNAFIKYFDYGGGSISEFRSSYTNSEWENMVYEELGKGNPILYGANGHAFVVDGHDGNGYVHINWGWTGTYDGFFLLTASPAINEEPMGGYFTGQEAVFGAMPNGAIPRLTTQGLTLTSNDVIEDLSSCPSIPVTLSMTVANLTGETHSFEQAIGLYKQGKLQTIVSQLDNINNMVTGTTKNQDVSFELESTLSQGVYSLIPVSREMGSNQWRMNGNPDQLITLSIYGGGAKLTVGVPEEEGDIITFACDEVRDVCVKYWDVNGDGALSKEEAAAVTSLSLRFLTNQSITSFDEFQYFTGVTTIAAVEFYNCPNLTSITFPPSITTIEERAFSTCNLKHLVIPKNVTSIGDKAFDSNYYMETIRVEAGNTVYDSRNNCNAIIETATNKLIKGCNNTTIPEDVVTIGSSAFSYCKNMKSIQVPNSVTNIEERAFLGCSNMLSITIPEGLTSILTDTFYGCESLAGIVIPSSVTSIGSYAFYGCSALPSVTIPEGVTNIGNSAFFKCTGLASVTIPSSVDSIGASAFSGCTGLASISLPNGLVSIGTSAFADCTGLTSVRIPNSVSSMGANPFHGCYNMQSLVVDANNARYKSVSNNSAILDIVTNTLVTGTASTIIPEGVVAIGSYAFYGCRGLTSITLPSSVTSIGSTAFRDCTSLQAIDIPSHVNSIGQDAFRNCRSLTSFVIPSSVTIIDQGVFLDCSGLKSVTIPYGVTSIGYDAFTYCTRLTSIKIPSSVKKIDSYSFMRCTSLTEITIPSSVTSIGTGAFQSCTKLASIKSYITRVFKTGKNAFNNCVNATLYVPKGLVDTYKSTTDWNKINFIKEIPVSYDVNGDGSIDISDVVCIVNRVLGASSDEDDSYDVNTDGKVDINDVVILVNVILGK